MMKEESSDEDFVHVSHSDIENAQIEIFKRQLSLHASSSQSLIKNFSLITPEKKNIKSSSNLKNKKKSKSIFSSNKLHEKSKEKKSTHSQVKVSEKKTIRKKVQKEQEDNKTAKKKLEPQPFVF